MPQVGSFHGFSVLAGILIVPMLSGCAKRLGGVQAPGAIVELVGRLLLGWERPTRKANRTFLTDIAATNSIMVLPAGRMVLSRPFATKPGLLLQAWKGGGHITLRRRLMMLQGTKVASLMT
jgi:hypothetical protein